MLARDNDHAVVVIVQIGIIFGNKFQTLGGIDPLMHRAGHAQNRHVEHFGCIGDRLRHLLRFGRHAIERTVRLDVEQ